MNIKVHMMSNLVPLDTVFVSSLKKPGAYRLFVKTIHLFQIAKYILAHLQNIQ